MYFLLPLLSSIDGEKFKISLFDNTKNTRNTESALKLKPHISDWHEISNLNDFQATELIRRKYRCFI